MSERDVGVLARSTRWAGAAVRCALMMTVPLMAACEAELRLDGVATVVADPVRRTDQFLAVETSGSGDVWAFADDGVVLRATRQSGAQPLNWQRDVLTGAPNFIGSTTCNDGSVYALSFENQLWAHSAGQWSFQVIPTEEQLQVIGCTAEGDLWAAGAFSTLLRSGDQGKTWDDASLYEDFTITATAFLPGGVGYAAGEFGTLLKTRDDGVNWAMLEPIADDFYPLAAHFSSPDEGWVSGVLGLIFHTKDGGASWNIQPTATAASIYGFAQATDRLFAFGDLGTLLLYVPSEGAWVDYPSPQIPVHFADAEVLGDSLLLVGGWGVIAEVPAGSSLPGPQAAGGGR